MAGLQALIFDVDGTLADTERDGHRLAFNRAFADAGLDWVWSEALYGELLAVTGGKERIGHYLAHHRPAFRPPGDPIPFIADLHQAKTRHYARMLAQGLIPLRIGVRRLLEEARAAGLRLGIATTTTPDNVTALIEHTLGAAAIGWFDVISAGDIVPAKKPAADIFHHALAAMALAPNGCLAFEDSHNGLQSSLGAGVPTLVTVNGYTRAQNFAGALLVVDHLGEPDRPFSVLSGDAHGARYVSVDLLRRLHAAAMGDGHRP